MGRVGMCTNREKKIHHPQKIDQPDFQWTRLECQSEQLFNAREQYKPKSFPSQAAKLLIQDSNFLFLGAPRIPPPTASLIKRLCLIRP